MRFLKFFFAVIFCFVLSTSLGLAEAPKHFYNDPENLHSDPNYVPGDYALGETHTSKTFYYHKKTQMFDESQILQKNALYSLGLGEVKFTSLKNEEAKVTGYFKNYFARTLIKEGAIDRVEMLIDVNSLDTGIPGRNNRILDIFFNSLNPDFGTITINFTAFHFSGDETFESLQPGIEYDVRASGVLSLNGINRPLMANFSIQQTEGIWQVKSTEPVVLKISDFDFGERIYQLMESCNHASLGNEVSVEVVLYFK